MCAPDWKKRFTHYDSLYGVGYDACAERNGKQSALRMITLVSGYVYQCLTFCPLSNHASIIFVHRREVQQRARSEETIKQYLPTNGSMGVEQAVSFVSVLDRIEVYALNKVRPIDLQRYKNGLHSVLEISWALNWWD